MKNLIINIYKTLFFFDFAIVAAYLIPKLKTGRDSLNALLSEAVFLATALVFTFIFIKFVEKGKLRVFNRRNKLRHYCCGLLVGILPIAATAVPLFIFKGLSFNGVNINSFSDVLIWIAAVFCNAAATELLLRGYLWKLYRCYYPLPAVCAVITVLFISMNIDIFSGGVIYAANLLLGNLALCFLAEYTHSLLAPITAHFFYNAVSSLILGSFAVSKDYPYIINTVYSGNKLFSGGDAKLEGSIIMLAANIALCLYFAKKLTGRKRK